MLGPSSSCNAGTTFWPMLSYQASRTHRNRCLRAHSNQESPQNPKPVNHAFMSKGRPGWVDGARRDFWTPVPRPFCVGGRAFFASSGLLNTLCIDLGVATDHKM